MAGHSCVHNRSGRFEEAAALADQAIAEERGDIGAWHLKGMSFIGLGRFSEAISVLSEAASIDPNDEFIRHALEDLLVNHTRVEDQRRTRWAAWHFDRARSYRSRNLAGQALFEYRRGLRLNPFAPDRREYAEILRLQGYPARYLEELRFLRSNGIQEAAVNDAIEAYGALLADAKPLAFPCRYLLQVIPHLPTLVSFLSFLFLFAILPQTAL